MLSFDIPLHKCPTVMDFNLFFFTQFDEDPVLFDFHLPITEDGELIKAIFREQLVWHFQIQMLRHNLHMAAGRKPIRGKWQMCLK